MVVTVQNFVQVISSRRVDSPMDASCEQFSEIYQQILVNELQSAYNLGVGWASGCDPFSFYSVYLSNDQDAYKRQCNVSGPTSPDSCGEDGYAGLMSRIADLVLPEDPQVCM